MTDKERILIEIGQLLRKFRKDAKEVNFESASKKDSAETLTIIGKYHTIKIQVL